MRSRLVRRAEMNEGLLRNCAVNEANATVGQEYGRTRDSVMGIVE
jgi:hypothetical protein